MCAKGFDAGEGFIIGAERRDGEIVFTPERTAFLPILSGDSAEAQIQSLGIYTLKMGDRRYVLGEDALRVARALKRQNELVVPFLNGMPDPETRKILATMVSAVLGKPANKGETIHFTVHGKPVDGNVDFQSMGGFWAELLNAVGYRPVAVSRGEATLLGGQGKVPPKGSTLHGVGISFGEMAVDVSIRSGGRNLDFSLLRGTDWIDQAVRKMKKVPLDTVRQLRESALNLEAVDLAHPLQGPLEIYFEHQIQYTLQQLVAQMMKARLNPNQPIPLIAAGSGATVPGFQVKLEKGLRKVKFPFKLKGLRVTRTPLQTAAGGALVKALVSAGQARGTPLRAAPPSPPPPPPVQRGPVKAGGPKAPRRISDAFRTVTQKFAPPAQSGSAGPAPQAKPERPTAPAEPSPQVVERLRRMEGRIAELEDKVLEENEDYVLKMRQAAGIQAKKTTSEEFRPFFKLMVEKGGSDLFLAAGSRPAVRMDGNVRFMGKQLMKQEFLIGLVEALSGKPYPILFANQKGVDMAIEMKGIGRFRANLFHQRGRLAGVFRYIKDEIPTFEELNLPSKTLMKLSAHQRGMILVTGVAGSGKSTTIAGMIEHINQSSNRHIVTIEDPIEFVFAEKQSVIDQREVGLDTANFSQALKSAVRQAPDVIFIGEMRDKETMEAAISAAETGHLVMSTLHTVNAQQTVERIITYFPPYQHNLIRLQLSMVLVGVISVRLMPKKGGRGRVPAVEIMMTTPTIREMLHTGKTKELSSAISEDVHFGNQTFNESLKQLYTSGVIDLEEALSAADNPDELKLEIRGIIRGSRTSDMNY